MEQERASIGVRQPIRFRGDTIQRDAAGIRDALAGMLVAAADVDQQGAAGKQGLGFGGSHSLH